jgi:hypothetical protein
MARGGSMTLDPATVIVVNGEKIKTDHFFRSQGRFQVDGQNIYTSFNNGFRCVYTAKPIR